MGGYHEMKRIKYIKCGGRIKGRINVGLVLIGIRSVLGIAYNPHDLSFSPRNYCAK
jgi:hypothetical protein